MPIRTDRTRALTRVTAPLTLVLLLTACTAGPPPAVGARSEPHLVGIRRTVPPFANRLDPRAAADAVVWRVATARTHADASALRELFDPGCEPCEQLATWAEAGTEPDGMRVVRAAHVGVTHSPGGAVSTTYLLVDSTLQAPRDAPAPRPRTWTLRVDLVWSGAQWQVQRAARPEP